MRIVTRGLGPNQMIVARGYGLSIAIVAFWGEILDFVSHIATLLDFNSVLDD